MKRFLTPRTTSRIVSAGMVLGSGAVLLLAAWLVPDTRGYGTDTQLGLGQCTFLAFTGYPCPMCGATTTFSHFAHLEPLTAILNQPFAAALFLLTVAVFSVALAEVIQPRDRWTRILRWIAPWEGSLATGFLVAMGAGWIYKIAVMKWLG